MGIRSVVFARSLTVLLFVGSTFCDLIRAQVSTSLEGDLQVLKNAALELAVSVSDGTIRRLVDTEDSVDYCHQLADAVWPANHVPVGERIGGVMIVDELRQKTFSDLAGKCEVTDFKTENTAESVVCSFEKTFPEAEFTVLERIEMFADHARWEVRAKKLSGPDRSVRIVQLLPLPTWGYTAWAPIAEAPFASNPWEPFQVNFGIVDGGPVGNTDWRTVIPMMVFYKGNQKNALCLVNPFEIPAVRIRYRNNIGVTQDFHWNSRSYSLQERPYLQVISEYLGLRDNRQATTGLLITVQPGNWRPSLGWVYEKYREYFDPRPGFEKYDGAYVIDQPYADSLGGAGHSRLFEEYYRLGTRWEEMHGHFPQYGQMIPPPSVKKWDNLSHSRPEQTKSRQKIADHARRAAAAGVGTFIYYNITESEWWFAKKEYPDDIATDEVGNPITAYRGQEYPGDRACWLMCADPESTKFGRDLAAQAAEMVKAYPGIAGFFWDVYGRTYRFDFAHDDGITMVNNKPAYFPIFMYTRMMDKVVGPLLHSSGRFITCNKPTVIQTCKGIDGVMAMENTPDEEFPTWLVAQSYTGLNRHVMILDSQSWQHPERLFLNCLRYGYFYSLVNSEITPRDSTPALRAQKKKAAMLREVYHPLIEKFRGKKWVFYPRALELPPKTDGNIFRLADGSVMISVVSIWRDLYNIPGATPNLEITCRLPDAGEFTRFELVQPDLTNSPAGRPIVPIERKGDTIRFGLDQHGLASVILLEK